MKTLSPWAPFDWHTPLASSPRSSSRLFKFSKDSRMMFIGKPPMTNAHMIMLDPNFAHPPEHKKLCLLELPQKDKGEDATLVRTVSNEGADAKRLQTRKQRQLLSSSKGPRSRKLLMKLKSRPRKQRPQRLIRRVFLVATSDRVQEIAIGYHITRSNHSGLFTLLKLSCAIQSDLAIRLSSHLHWPNPCSLATLLKRHKRFRRLACEQVLTNGVPFLNTACGRTNLSSTHSPNMTNLIQNSLPCVLYNLNAFPRVGH